MHITYTQYMSKDKDIDHELKKKNYSKNIITLIILNNISLRLSKDRDHFEKIISSFNL